MLGGMEESNEAKLLKILIGYVHVMAVNNLAAIRHLKTFSDCTPDQQNILNSEVASGATQVAAQTSATLSMPTGETPPVVN